ncbi:MAG: LPS glycosyltransferase [uncultured bacterium]|nr:MAG: LPS glycosyltransferase [uncultured bacterium]OGJ47066.1 MAG: hypothetical protein A2244_05000 [Candidatus Peregrinibacteria bacterium RIFOXYA2_FULL_41_18]OGJ49754.1 MAG: hypothetical protein A2344_03660 [Candidatus Peregrinibacteria bacterium RIFOXYB12_FULL_41_12]OGJ54095.1 MAG: hypothetical protein A2336_03765 [Candidatus Peregrinibacteria bacterium RIFOXYB2_FULL_41_88]
MVQEKRHILMLTGDSGIAYNKQNVFFEMLRGFSEHFERVSVICPSNEKGGVIQIHKNVYLYPSSYKKFLHLDFFRHKNFILKTVREIHKKNHIDLITAHAIPPCFANVKAAMALSKELNVHYVVELMHIPGYPKAENWMERIERASLNKFFKKNRNNIPHLRLINKSDTYNYVTDRLGFPKDKILHIPAFYLDFEVFKTDDSVVRNSKQFVFCGRLEKNKGLDLLLDAADKVAAEVPEFELKIVGDGSMRDFVQKRTNKNIELLGWLPTQKDVAQIYQTSAGIVMTSYNEGGPRVTLEAMACGALSITTRVGVMNEVVLDRKNALFIDWDASDIAEKILWAIKNPDDSAEIAEEGRKSVQKFEYREALKFYADTYLNLIDAK